jgi:hypothetical protein
MPESLDAMRRRIADESAGAQQVVRHVAAGVAPQRPPKSVPASVFHMSQAAGIVKHQGAPFDPAAVVISDRQPGQYKPTQAVTGYRALYERMLPGQCAELPRDKAAAFARWAKARGIELRRESIGPGMVGVWRGPCKSADPSTG